MPKEQAKIEHILFVEPRIPCLQIFMKGKGIRTNLITMDMVYFFMNYWQERLHLAMAITIQGYFNVYIF